MVLQINYNFLLLLVTTFFFFILKGITASESLCDNPVLHSADRMVNGTVRLFRGNQYWELKGLPDKIGVLSGPFKVWYPNFGSVYRNTSIMSCLVCNRKGYIFKFEGNKWWSWQTSGEQWKGDQNGEVFKDMPNSDKGFDVVFHNGKQDNPLMIGFIGNKVFYYSTKGYLISLAPDFEKNGYIGGKFEEKFPTGIEAAFSWPPNTPEEGYYVYLFKGNKYCFRKEKTKNGKECEEWRLNKELFGCDMSGAQNEDQTDQQPVNSDNEEKEEEVTVKIKERQQSDEEMVGPDLDIDPDLRETTKTKSNIPDTAYESNTDLPVPQSLNNSLISSDSDPKNSSEPNTSSNSSEDNVNTVPHTENTGQKNESTTPFSGSQTVVDHFNAFMITISISLYYLF